MAPRAAELMEMAELVELFLLRLPLDDPASLVRAALVCKLWHRILADRGFRRRFCDLNRRPPILGFFTDAGPRYTPTSSFRPRNADFQSRYAIDSRHGRVLLARSCLPCQVLHTNLAVWDPISGDRLELPELPAAQLHRHHMDNRFHYHWNAAVLCASIPSSACDSIECHSGHFLVVLMMASKHGVYAFVYSSQAGTWSETTFAAQDPLHLKFLNPSQRSAIVGNALYFKFFTGPSSGGILKYDMDMQEISSINLPSNYSVSEIFLTTTEYGGLGIASVQSSRLHLWTGKASPGGQFGWAPSRVIELKTVLPANIHSICVVAFLHGLGAFLVSTNDGVFSIDMESYRAWKVCEDRCGRSVVPYVCFCTPGASVRSA